MSFTFRAPQFHKYVTVKDILSMWSMHFLCDYGIIHTKEMIQIIYMILRHVSSKEWAGLPELICIYQIINSLIKYSIWWKQIAGIEERMGTF